ncbi:MAG: hypothetical protein AAGD01_01035 [Acidobacteriota bacterium]
MSALDVWQKHLRRWLPAALFFLINAALVITYLTGGYGSEVNLLDQRVQARQSNAAELENEAMALEGRLQRAQLNRDRVQELYSQRLSTQERRLTEMIAELRTLAAQAGLKPKQVSYPRQSLEEYDLVQMAFVFNVEGTYAELRQLINALQLTDSFLTLEEIGLSQSGGRSANGQLSISLRISTLFADANAAGWLIANADNPQGTDSQGYEYSLVEAGEGSL